MNRWILATLFATSAAQAQPRVDVSLAEKRLYVIENNDTLRVAPIAVAMGRRFSYAGRSWNFITPRGDYKVLGKRADPVWIPPDWHYAEVARDYNLQLDSINKPRTVRDASLLMRNGRAGLQYSDGFFSPLPLDEHIVFRGKLYIPPLGSQNRRVAGVLGDYALDLGNGYLLHGTPDKASIGTASTHGCIRLHDEDIEWLYQNIPVGARVRIR